jgi:hypothetical protein
MYTVQQKAQAVLWYGKFEPIIQVRREFRHECGVRPPDNKSIRGWYEQLERLSVWKKDILLGGLGDLMKMRIMTGRPSCGV